MSKDNINHPSHYNSGKKLETYLWIERGMSNAEYIGFIKGNIYKYLHRYDMKGGLEDLKKAEWYLKELMRFLNEGQG